MPLVPPKPPSVPGTPKSLQRTFELESQPSNAANAGPSTAACASGSEPVGPSQIPGNQLTPSVLVTMTLELQQPTITQLRSMAVPAQASIEGAIQMDLFGAVSRQVSTPSDISVRFAPGVGGCVRVEAAIAAPQATAPAITSALVAYLRGTNALSATNAMVSRATDARLRVIFDRSTGSVNNVPIDATTLAVWRKDPITTPSRPVPEFPRGVPSPDRRMFMENQRDSRDNEYYTKTKRSKDGQGLRIDDLILGRWAEPQPRPKDYSCDLHDSDVLHPVERNVVYASPEQPSVHEPSRVPPVQPVPYESTPNPTPPPPTAAGHSEVIPERYTRVPKLRSGYVERRAPQPQSDTMTGSRVSHPSLSGRSTPYSDRDQHIRGGWY